jgi:DNA primase
MAKIAPTSIKYIIHGTFKADGAIEKPDVIGAVFGQTEGLLGEDMEMRELQKTGKIGRIEVNLTADEGKTLGEIEIPSAMDKTETSLIAAALETIEKIGPSETKINVERIEDVRGSKRDYIMERAKELLGKIEGSNDLKDMGKELGVAKRAASINTYGRENIACGDISGKEIIIVEGRADVVNMLKQGVDNVICMNGVKLPETVRELTKEKEVTLFVDGDRGGKLIIKNVTENAEVDYITMAPEGKEVEELTSKEILQALRKKLPVKDFLRRGSRGRSYSSSAEVEEKPKKERKIKKLTDKQKQEIKGHIEEVVGTKAAILFNDALEIIKKIPISRLGYFTSNDPIFAVAINDTALPNVIRAAEKLDVQHLVAKNFTTTDTDISLIPL